MTRGDGTSPIAPVLASACFWLNEFSRSRVPSGDLSFAKSAASAASRLAMVTNAQEVFSLLAHHIEGNASSCDTCTGGDRGPTEHMKTPGKSQPLLITIDDTVLSTSTRHTVDAATPHHTHPVWASIRRRTVTCTHSPNGPNSAASAPSSSSAPPVPETLVLLRRRIAGGRNRW
jgi:hypothetical protein